jgi:hypothetical protein
VQHRLADREKTALPNPIVRTPLAGAKSLTGMKTYRHQQDVSHSQNQ